MFETTTLVTFLTASIAIILAPGPAQTLVLARTLNDGMKAGIMTALGLNIGTIIHSLAAALGLSAILITSALAFTIVKILGALYLVYLGVKAFLDTSISAETIDTHSDHSQTLTKSIITGVLNPKVALFFLAFLPQFIDPHRGSVFLQFLLLGSTVAMMDILYESLLAVIAGTATKWFSKNPKIYIWRQRISGIVLVGLGVRLAFMEHH